MLQVGETYKYFYAKGEQGTNVTIEHIANDTAYATSETVGAMSFSMQFNINTNKGINLYAGTYLEDL